MKCIWLLISLIIPLNVSFAAKITVDIFATNNPSQSIGHVVLEDTSHGLLITPSLKDLPPGQHGFHVHEEPNCGEQGMKAGGHYDPHHTNTHQGPYAQGHLGDLPVLCTNQQGIANTPIIAPQLKIKDLHGRALIIHKGGDNYSDNPKLGGGGDRIACGVIQ